MLALEEDLLIALRKGWWENDFTPQLSHDSSGTRLEASPLDLTTVLVQKALLFIRLYLNLESAYLDCFLDGLFFSFFFCGGEETQDLMHARQVLFHWAVPQALASAS
jgi:hypothetical protein